MWFFRAVAFDLDGTLTTGDSVARDTLARLDAARADRAVILVTGRIGAELEAAFPGLVPHFDAVVTENGAVLHRPGAERVLAPPVDPAVDKQLADRGIAFRRGRALLALDAVDGPAISTVIAALGLDCQVVFNRGAAMVLPAGVTKGTGLLAALDELGLSPHNTVAIGDAQNDLALLRAAEVGAAVGNAVPALAEHADLRIAAADGAGVAALLAGPLLAGHERFCPERRWVPVGDFDDGEPALLPGSQASILIAGDSGSGKSYLAGLLVEEWVDAGYSVLVIDPEGDHGGLSERPGVHLIDAASPLPAPGDLLALAHPGHGSIILDLSGLDADARIDYLRRLPAAITSERARYGIPHWVVYDEAHQHSWLAEYVHSFDSAADPGTCLVTWQPQSLPDGLLRNVEIVLTAQGAPGMNADRPAFAELRRAGEGPRRFAVGTRLSRHVRHRRKYAAVPLPEHRRFRFHTQPGMPVVEAGTVEEFAQQLRHCDQATLDHHLSRGDFSRWADGTLADQQLAAELAAAERDMRTRHAAALEVARAQALAAIEHRYLSN